MSLLAEFEKLPIEEQIRVVQAFWDHIAESPKYIPIPKWHKTVLERRQKEGSEAPDSGQDWAVVKKRLLEAL
ncbi:addiction module protein [Acanthopleuribacter pedis]|uniref:Addiction module protein n=1 Tax=Acanthopleuribacter pedis TaxID=442870 RepID=A0A8J7QC88_9BACT|nr:addiction module protein [Acanthopleuribacter pedis]MBO1323026.1 addiction module protein [Acanthopleuribacter pedis]